MTKEENAGYVDKTEPERKSFVASLHLKVFQSHRLRFAFPRPLGWNGEGRSVRAMTIRSVLKEKTRLAGMTRVEVFAQCRQNRAEEKRFRSLARPKNLFTTKPRATRHVQHAALLPRTTNYVLRTDFQQPTPYSILPTPHTLRHPRRAASAARSGIQTESPTRDDGAAS